MIKQVIVVRTNLNMRKGKMCAQVAHASMKVFFDRISMEGTYEWSPGTMSGKDVLTNAYNDFTDQMSEWMEGSFTKIVVGCNSEQELFDLQKKANEANIVNALILDNGNTEFKEVCDNCIGTGKIRTFSSVEKYNNKEINCGKCNGTGKVNKPTYTCLAIGPDEAEKIDKITGELKLI